MASIELSFQNIQNRIRPYVELARYDKPIGIWLLCLPAFWGLTIASKGIPSLNQILLFFLGAALMRGAGCIMNDIIDHPYDRYVERTQNRPLAQRTLSFNQALVWMGCHLVLAAFILMQFNKSTILLGFVALLLTFLYPWMKRITNWPQVFLGI